MGSSGSRRVVEPTGEFEDFGLIGRHSGNRRDSFGLGNLAGDAEASNLLAVTSSLDSRLPTAWLCALAACSSALPTFEGDR